jgi:site-specific DNA-methyltransferase (adenine-specific)
MAAKPKSQLLTTVLRSSAHAVQRTLLQGDCIELGCHAPLANLIYMDPPFAVGTDFRARGSTGTRSAGPVAYRDTWKSLDDYLDWFAPRLHAAFSQLAERGSLWLQLDHRAVHEAKVLACAKFGRESFRGEVIWIPGNGSKSRNGIGMSHQTLLIFSKHPMPIWNAQDPVLREAFADTSLRMHFTQRDAEGRAYRERVIAGKAYRYFADVGRAIGSVWSDCPAMHANSPLRKETTGYPTQKPLKLLDRIVRATTAPGDWVVDPFFGSATTLHAALAAGRQAFGMDVGDLAIATARNRLTAAFGQPLAPDYWAPGAS